MKLGLQWSAAAFALACMCTSHAEADQTAPRLTSADYARAERLLPWNRNRYFINGDIQHYWMGDEDRFWYRREDAQGNAQFVIVDARDGSRSPAFDHAVIAAGMSAATGEQVASQRLPFEHFRYAERGQAIELIWRARKWRCALARAQCSQEPAPELERASIRSPDGRWSAFVRDYNVWVRASEDGREFPLTDDGERYFGYAAVPADDVLADRLDRSGLAAAPALIWSPDSRKILTHRVDERQVGDMHLVQAVPDDGSLRPKLHTYRYSMPNEEHQPLLTQWVLDVATRRRVGLDFPMMTAVFQAPLQNGYAWWSENSERVYYVERGRYYRTLALKAADAATGRSRTLIEESAQSYIEPAGIGRLPMVRVLSNGDFLWYSERDGWAQLYLHDGRTGRVKRRISRPGCVVRNLVRVDERAGLVYFSASGCEPKRNPYLRHLYRSTLDGSHVELLTPEDADHRIFTTDEDLFGLRAPAPLANQREQLGFSASGRYFVDVYSRPDRPSVAVLRTAAGKLVDKVEATNTDSLSAAGIVMPEMFEATAADGVSRIYGVIHRPSRFDPSKRYPVIDSIYPGPQMTRVQYNFPLTVFDSMGGSALAELGFIVVAVDGRGTPQRSRSFRDHSYGRLDKASDLDDHVAAIKQLAGSRPWMDLKRVGIVGYSAGGYAAARAMFEHPEFYRVGVAGAGNHDPRAYVAVWGETYVGPDENNNYATAANARLAGQLRGKLLLIHGELDHNVHPAHTLRVVDSLVKANKDFDLLILPGVGHGSMLGNYATRREWDYFVRYLMAAEPPSEYRIGAASSNTE